MYYTNLASPLTDSVGWIAGLLTGTAATVVAILAVATIGFSMLRGRMPLARGATVVLGCFILFSASEIAQALIAGTAGSNPPPAAMLSPPPSYTPTEPQAGTYDPYAGASVPVTPPQQVIR